jgi:TRAP-type C4-dicarboxylate transport system permease large subunit
VLIAACSIARTDIWETTKANFGFISVLLLVLVLCTYVPWFSLVLIEYFYK